MSKTTAELCEEAIDGWKKTTEEILPVYFVLAFVLGQSKKKSDVKYLFQKGKLKEPFEIDLVNELLEKGVKLTKKIRERIVCPSCDKEHLRSTNLKFCGFCGNELNLVKKVDLF